MDSWRGCIIENISDQTNGRVAVDDFSRSLFARGVVGAALRTLDFYVMWSARFTEAPISCELRLVGRAPLLEINSCALCPPLSFLAEKSILIISDSDSLRVDLRELTKFRQTAFPDYKTDPTVQRRIGRIFAVISGRVRLSPIEDASY